MSSDARDRDNHPAETVPIPPWVNPDLEHLMTVHRRQDGNLFRSWAESKVDLPSGAIFARINGITAALKQDYATTQAGPSAHFFFNSDLYFCNHSCAPSLECDTSKWEIRVSRRKPLKKGDVLSLFYPSTEWTMDREFQCWCGAGKDVCCGTIKGARDMDEQDLQRFWLNDHIHHLRQQVADGCS